MRRLIAALFSLAMASTAQAETQTAIFAGGCFWSVESNFDKVPGVLSTTSGYIGGSSANPTYENHHAAGHREAVKITFDTSRVSYEQMLTAFFHSIDPTDAGGTFCDRGHSYTTAVYALGRGQEKAAQLAKAQAAAELGKPVATEVRAAPTFWPAEEYHQDFHLKNPEHYAAYRQGCGRDPALQAVWGNAAFKGIKG